MRKIILLLSLIIIPHITIASACHPAVSPNSTQFLVGYGSLISESSKKNTLSNVGPNQPVVIQGYSREWNMRAPQKKMTFLGVVSNSKKSFNGVVFQIQPQAINAFDIREIGYCREEVMYEHITFLHEPLDKHAQYWIYVPKNKCKKPYDKNLFPVAGYYQKIFLQGCKEIENNFSLKGYYQQCLKDMPVL